MKSFKEFIIEEKEKASIRGEVERRLAYEREVMGMGEPTSMAGEMDVEIRRRLQLFDQLEKERESEYPEEAAKKRRDNKIANDAWALGNAINIPFVSPWLRGEAVAATARQKGNPTSIYNKEIPTLERYPNDFDTGMPEPDVRHAPSAVKPQK